MNEPAARGLNKLYRPIAIGVRPVGTKGYPIRARLGSRLNWEPMAGHLDWDTVSGWRDFEVRIRYAEYEETRKKSDNPAYDGRVDYRRVPGGHTFAATVCKVEHGCGDHFVSISAGGVRPTRVSSTRIIPASQVIDTMRLFLSSQYLRHGLALSIVEQHPVGAVITENPPRISIRKV